MCTYRGQGRGRGSKLTKSECTYFMDEPQWVYSRNNLPKITDGAYVINFDEYHNAQAHWITLYCNNNHVIYVDSFGV